MVGSIVEMDGRNPEIHILMIIVNICDVISGLQQQSGGSQLSHATTVKAGAAHIGAC